MIFMKLERWYILLDFALNKFEDISDSTVKSIAQENTHFDPSIQISSDGSNTILPNELKHHFSNIKRRTCSPFYCRTQKPYFLLPTIKLRTYVVLPIKTILWKVTYICTYIESKTFLFLEPVCRICT